MQISSPKPWRLMQSAWLILKTMPSILIPVAIAHLFKLCVTILIITPLVHGYAENKFEGGLVNGLKSLGINLYGPRIYIVIALILFVAYCISVLAHCLVFSSMLQFFKHEKAGLRKSLSEVRKKLIPILSYALINKTWGVLLRFSASLIRLLPDESQPNKNYSWQINNLFTLLLMLDKNQRTQEAMNNSKIIVVQKLGTKLRFSLIMLKPFLILLLLIALPTIIGILMNNSTALWIGGGLSVFLWCFISLISSGLGLITHAAFYEWLVNDHLIDGFNEIDLKNGIVSKGSR
jgi:hypothetical protein